MSSTNRERITGAAPGLQSCCPARDRGEFGKIHFMLVLTRKMSQVIKLGDDITLTVVRTSHGAVQLGIEAPANIRILRAECEAIPRGLLADQKVA